MWIKVQALFKDEMPDVEWDMLDREGRYAASHPNEFRFNTDDLICYNKTYSENETTINLKEYGSIMICMTIEEFDEIIFPK
jgi:hypothetical protein